MIRNDPEMHRGMLEVVEMFRNRDKEGLKMYLQKFLPHMDDATVEDFIIGSGDTAGIEGQLIRLGSGRDYAGKIEMMKKLERNKALRDLDVSKMKPNAEGGRIGLFLGGGLTGRKRST
jgi:ATP-dependent protease HslVU (ClpYQ) peptidase subunit